MSQTTTSEESDFDNSSLKYVKRSSFTACIEGFNSDSTDQFIEYFNNIKMKNIVSSSNNIYIQFNSAEDFKNAFALTTLKKFGECTLEMKKVSEQENPFIEGEESTNSEYSIKSIDHFDLISFESPEINDTTDTPPTYTRNDECSFRITEATNEPSTSSACYVASQEAEDNFFSALFDVNETDDETQNTKVVPVSENTQEEENSSKSLENQKIFKVRKEVCELYQCLMQEFDDDVSSKELQQHHAAARDSVLEHFMIETSALDDQDLVEQNFEALSMEIEVSFESLQNKQTKEQESRESELAPEMLQAVYNAADSYEKRLSEKCLNVDEFKEITEGHAEALPEALDLFELLTEYMTENKSVANRKLLTVVDEIYDRLYKQQTVIFIEKSREDAKSWFVEALREDFEDATDFAKCSKYKSVALAKFEEATLKFLDDPSKIKTHRNLLEESLHQEWINLSVCMAVSQRSEAVEKYRRAMSTACESATSERELGQLNEQASMAAIHHYILKTSGLPQSVVTEQQNALTQDIKVESAYYKMENIEHRILKRHEMQNQQLSRAIASGLEVYMSETEQPEDCEGDVLRELETRHQLAQDVALNTFNLMTENLTPELVTVSRDNLNAEILKNYSKYKRFLTESFLKQQVKSAQTKFSERMRHAVQVDDMFTQLQDQAQNETLVNFDLATTEFDREAVAEHRAKLEEFFELSIELVETARTSAVEKGLCCVCTEKRATVVFQPCLHFNTCDTCAANLTSCAMCRAPIQNKLHVYQ